ncbi:S8 family serine peptidase, partial [Elioraea sp.]|uniref:S8 family serine peptidase n=1 Tax=Elioraea sp. TaxID=2185103 RepID=UPI003F71BA70
MRAGSIETLQRCIALLPVCALALALAGPAVADDDDSDDADAPGAPAGVGGAPGGPGGRGGGGDRGPGRPDLGPNPGRGFPSDVRDLMGMLFGRPPQPQRALPLPAPPPPEAPEAEDRELVARDLDAAARTQAVAEGFTIVAERGAVTRLRAPAGLGTAAARDRLRTLAPAATVDFNHFFRTGQARAACPGGSCVPSPHFALVGWPDGRACGGGLEVGLIDTRIDPVLARASGRIDTITLRSPDRAPSTAAHGTAVATLLAGGGPIPGLLPAARIVAVDAFHHRPEGDVADAFDIASAIGLLADRGVTVVAMPFAGPANAVVEEAGAAAAARGMAAVAAAGNDGPRAAPRYPAAHSWATGVTAVDREARVFAQAGRGPHIAFAAPGVGLPVLVAAGRPPVTRSGTS